MGYGFKAEFWGPWALFTRPELKVERMSYDVPTPSAARGMLEAIFWKSGLKYVIDKIYVLNPIKFDNIRRNEVSEKVLASKARQVMQGGGGPIYIDASAAIQQRASTVLKDVHYIFEAHFEMTDKAGGEDSPEKFYNMILRRLRKGQCYHQPAFGTREFPAHFRLFEEESITTAYEGESRDLGLMLYDMDYTNTRDIKPMYFRATLENGILDLCNCEVLR